jgi:RNA polymerase subunit RPABC4/transcription elongation factor Spt4
MKVKLKIRKPPRPEVPTFCAECHSPIAADATFCGACHAPIVRRYCPKCSRLVPENTKDCPFCGASSKAKPRETPGLSNLAVFGVIGMGVAFFLIAGFFPSEKEKPKIAPPPNVQLADSVAPVNVTGAQVTAGTTLPAKGQQPVVQSDAEGARLNLQAYELIQQKNYQEAEPILRRALQSFRPGTTAVEYKYAMYNLGHVLRRTGRAKEAIPYLEQCVKMDPAWSKAQTELAVAKGAIQPKPATQVSQHL